MVSHIYCFFFFIFFCFFINNCFAPMDGFWLFSGVGLGDTCTSIHSVHFLTGFRRTLPPSPQRFFFLLSTNYNSTITPKDNFPTFDYDS